jgi:hypothetical protein
MREFLCGWRRKAGVFTLVMAAFSIALWVRSAFVANRVEYPVNDTLDYVISLNASGICFEEVSSFDGRKKGDRYIFASVHWVKRKRDLGIARMSGMAPVTYDCPRDSS